MKGVVLLGKGRLAVRVGQWFVDSQDYELVHVVPVIPEPTWTDSLSDWAASRGIPVVESGHYKDLPSVDSETWSCDLGISVFYDKIIRAWFIDKCGRLLNIHNSPLPRYRGVSPINWALKNGEREHGVTIHEITPGIDDGPIVSQVKYTIHPDVEEVKDVYDKALAYAEVLFERTMPLLDELEAVPQDESEASYYSLEDNPRLGDRRFFTRAESQEMIADGANL